MGRAKNFYEPRYRNEKLWDGLVEIGGDGFGCWEWQGKYSERHVPLLQNGEFQTNRVHYDVRRIVWQEVFGKFPYGRAVARANCRNFPKCCSPYHLHFTGLHGDLNEK